MKQLNKIAIAVLILLFTFSTTVYYSCKKDPCNGVTCSNGGVCSGGNCKCPTGYSGDKCQTMEPSTIIYQNNTFTPVNITINATKSVIPVGGTVIFQGAPGASASGSASTRGVTSAGIPIGLTLSWSLSDVFPAGNTSLTRYLNASSGYYYLQVINNSGYYLTQEHIDYLLPSETVDSFTIYNIYGKVNPLGYQIADSSSNIYLNTTDPVVNYYAAPVFTFTQNQIFTYTAN